MTKVKICGITTLDDACFAVEAGADMLGLNFYPKSKRYISPENAAKICQTLRETYGEGCPVLVGVFVNESAPNMLETLQTVGLDFAQLSGDELAEILVDLNGAGFKVIRPATLVQAQEETCQYALHSSISEDIPSLLLDAYHPDEYGGTGLQAAEETANVVKAGVTRLMLAGGLTPDNVAERVAAVQPWGVDVASGVESGQPGVKDRDKVRTFIQAVRAVESV
ncbi:MAG TPA: phosphoribosylanthranilate isomerase [Phototrophicaceae bacterium]|jgi:phosphoribosylanthranilate isomerase|nr:phosphoribosylanthranilate isomerase [Phototrophicaceae bacterium]